jgi:peptide chain release factor 2
LWSLHQVSRKFVADVVRQKPASLLYGGGFDCEIKQRRLDELRDLESSEHFWTDTRQAKTLLKEKTQLETVLDHFLSTTRRLGDVQALLEMVATQPTEDDLKEVQAELAQLLRDVRAMEVREMLSGPNDAADAIVSINSGAGGTEAQDWAQILLRMYLRYCETRGWQTSVLDMQQGEEAGIKSATFLAKGRDAYGYLSAENGVHRLVRISPFDSNKRRHTSFASVYVYPDIEEEIEIEVKEADLRVDTYRSGGAGGQKVNKTDSAVRLTHLPSGIVVACQNERSQHQNRAMAMKILKARLYERELEARKAEQKVVEDTKMDIAWGSQIRSYVLHPYRMAKDHRTDHESGDVNAVLDGALQPFVETYLMSRSK